MSSGAMSSGAMSSGASSLLRCRGAAKRRVLPQLVQDQSVFLPVLLCPLIGPFLSDAHKVLKRRRHGADLHRAEHLRRRGAGNTSTTTEPGTPTGDHRVHRIADASPVISSVGGLHGPRVPNP